MTLVVDNGMNCKQWRVYFEHVCRSKWTGETFNTHGLIFNFRDIKLESRSW